MSFFSFKTFRYSQKRLPSFHLLGRMGLTWIRWTFTPGQATVRQDFEQQEDLLASLSFQDCSCLLLPLRSVLLLYLHLPSCNEKEVKQMAALQLEKAVLGNPETMVYSTSILRRYDQASDVLAFLLRPETLEPFASLFFQNKHWPQTCYLQVDWIAHYFQQAPRTLLLYQEGSDFILALFEQGRLDYAEVLPSHLQKTWKQEPFEQALWKAELNGITSTFQQILLGPSCLSWAFQLHQIFSVPVHALEIDPQAPPKLSDLSPPVWEKEKRTFSQKKYLQRIALSLGAIYLLGVCLLLAFFFYLQSQIALETNRLSHLQSQALQAIELQARWLAWAPALDPDHFPLELLAKIYQALPDPETRLTQFQLEQGQITLLGEASTLALANQMRHNLQQQFPPETFQLDYPPPRPLPNKKYQFHFTLIPSSPSP